MTVALSLSDHAQSPRQRVRSVRCGENTDDQMPLRSIKATFGDLCRAPSGIAHVVVNGEIVIAADAQTSARPGKVLQSR